MIGHRAVWCTMDSLSLSLVILVLFIPLLVFFTTAKWGAHNEGDLHLAATEQVKETLHTQCIRMQRSRSRSLSRDYSAVLRQNVAVARLMKMEGMPLI
jgi:hypothetical protein